MADTFYGINRGQVRSQVVVQASDPSTHVHLRLNSSSAVNKREVWSLVRMLLQRALQNFPPAADTFYGINRGETRSSITVDTSTTSKELEIKVLTAGAVTRHELWNLGRVLADKCVFGTFPPA